MAWRVYTSVRLFGTIRTYFFLFKSIKYVSRSNLVVAVVTNFDDGTVEISREYLNYLKTKIIFYLSKPLLYRNVSLLVKFFFHHTSSYYKWFFILVFPPSIKRQLFSSLDVGVEVITHCPLDY